MDKIIEKIEALRKEILNDKNVNVLDKGVYCTELCEIRLEVEELELKSDLLHNVVLAKRELCKCKSKSPYYWNDKTELVCSYCEKPPFA